MGVQHEQAFWNETVKYHDLVEEYERNIEVTHPGYVSSNRLAPYSNRGVWNTTSVVYYEHRP